MNSSTINAIAIIAISVGTLWNWHLQDERFSALEHQVQIRAQSLNGVIKEDGRRDSELRELTRVSNQSVSYIRSLIALGDKTADILGEMAPRLKPTATRTDWVGHPMVSDNDRYTPSQGWLSHVKIGLRTDGVVVWRNEQKVDNRPFNEFAAPTRLQFDYRMRP